MKGQEPRREGGRQPRTAGSRPWRPGEGGARCTEPRLATLLPRYDDLDPAARAALDRHVAACPACGPRFELLLAADRWLGTGEGRSAGRCPEAEELYDFGRGPGYRPLESGRRAEIEAHVAACPSCRDFARTLDAPIPVPWTAVPLRETPREAREAGARADTAPAPRRARLVRFPPRAWLPVAVAAAAAVLLVTRPGLDRGGKSAEGVGSVPAAFPTAPVLRGEGSATLLFPRGAVLAAESVPDGSAFGGLLFELAPLPEADAWRVLVRRHGGGAFEAGEPVAVLEGDEPRLDGRQLALDPGHYTWEARATVRGLERPLGERDFQVVVDDTLEAEWNALEELAEPERGVRRVVLLHERGYLADARAFARTLPQSPERDAFLAAVPGR